MCKRRNLEGTTCIKSFYHHFPEKRRVKDFMMVKVKVKGDSGSSQVFSFNCANIYIYLWHFMCSNMLLPQSSLYFVGCSVPDSVGRRGSNFLPSPKYDPERLFLLHTVFCSCCLFFFLQSVLYSNPSISQSGQNFFLFPPAGM